MGDEVTPAAPFSLDSKRVGNPTGISAMGFFSAWQEIRTGSPVFAQKSETDLNNQGPHT